VLSEFERIGPLKKSKETRINVKPFKRSGFVRVIAMWYSLEYNYLNFKGG
jgi:hypothetical protein